MSADGGRTDPAVARIATDRVAGYLDEAALRDALAAAGFDDGSAAAAGVDHLLEAAPEDLAVPELLAGCAAAPDPMRALNNLSRLVTAPERPTCPVSPAALTRFLGASQHMADLLLLRPELVSVLGRPFDPVTADARYLDAGASPEAETALRRAQQEDLLAIAWADLVEGLDVEQVTILLSRLADAVVAGAARGIGADRHFAIVALGKLGGMELNYSSDVDLMFVRPDSVTDQALADRIARQLLQLLGRQTVDGHLYRIDMRLRPEGSAGALTRTVSSSLDYYRRRGRPWERQMLTKARVVLDTEGAGDAFLQQTRQWVLDCGLDSGAILQFKRLKDTNEARSSDDDRPDVKQAPGGIRDIETIVQFLALLHAGQNPWLLCNATLHGLERLRVAGAVTSLEAARLRRAYLFHRRVENLLQLLHRVQTHRLPVNRAPLARLMGMTDVDTFDVELEEHRHRVRVVFERHFAQAFPTLDGPAAEISQCLLDAEPDVERFESTLGQLGFRDARAARRCLSRAAAPVSRFLPASPRLLSSFASIAPQLLERLSLAADPDAALDRFETMTRGVGAREILYAQLHDEPELMTMLSDLADGSPYLADTLAQEPQIFDAFVDALLTGSRGRQRRRESLLRLVDTDADPWLLLSDYKKIETLRTGVRDLQDAIPTPAVLAELSHLCIDVLRCAYDLVLADVQREHGTPSTIKGMSAKVAAHMVVVALGKVGGLEANYGSDADVLFIYSGEGETDRGVPNSVFFAKVAERLIARMGGMAGSPRLYKMDARLRPEGAKGPLVTSLRAAEHYYTSSRAALFEHQALLKARVVAGDAGLGQRVLGRFRNTIRKLDLPDDLASALREVRGKIEAKAHGHDLKRGTGGMVDIEQLTQYMQMRHAREDAGVLVQETPRALQLLADRGHLRPELARWLTDTYLFFRRIETRLQIALGLDTKEVPEDGPALRTLALRLGYADTSEGGAGHLLLNDLEEATAATRTRYEELMA